METLTNHRLRGASPCDQELHDAIVAHERDKEEMISVYENLARTASSRTIRYLLDLILEDEQRHHRMLRELRNHLRAVATLEERDPRIPTLDITSDDRDHLGAIRHLLNIEHKERMRLGRLARRMRRSDGEMDALVVRLLLSDSDPHIQILRFIEDHLEH